MCGATRPAGERPFAGLSGNFSSRSRVENSIGQLNVTTVFAQEAAPKKLKAVHSRHGYLQMSVGRYVSEPAVSQNYGECEILE